MKPQTPILGRRIPGRRAAGCRLLACIALLAATAIAGQTAATNNPDMLRFGFSKSMFEDLNQNDARAAMKVYSHTLGDDNQIPIDSNPMIMDGTNAIVEALRRHDVDIISLTSEEFITSENQGLDGPLIVSRVNRSITEEYVLLVRVDSRVQKLEDLRGTRLILGHDIRTSLAHLWLEVLCRENGLGPANQVFASQSTALKATQVILPVFFGKMDACVATRNAWMVMGELNPQVTNQLRALAVSHPVIPGLCCFRSGLSPALKERLITVAKNSTDKPAFKQLMALFKTDNLEPRPVSELAGTRELVARFRNLSPAAAIPPVPTPPSKEAPAQ
jgi:phosphonate transport system substrate-binding protein